MLAHDQIAMRSSRRIVRSMISNTRGRFFPCSWRPTRCCASTRTSANTARGSDHPPFFGWQWSCSVRPRAPLARSEGAYLGRQRALRHISQVARDRSRGAADSGSTTALRRPWRAKHGRQSGHGRSHVFRTAIFRRTAGVSRRSQIPDGTFVFLTDSAGTRSLGVR
jgi:hypothetical protein